MNGSYYKTPVFINDIERQSSSPTFDIGAYNKDLSKTLKINNSARKKKNSLFNN